MRYECIEDSRSKFWEIVLEGKSFRVTWGRIGTPGQTKEKTFGSSALARAAHDKLVAEKVEKGYRPAKPSRKTSKSAKVVKSPKPAKAAVTQSSKKAPARDVAKTIELIESYSEAIMNVPGLETRRRVLKPSSASAIASLEKSVGIEIPNDVKAFLERGLKSIDASLAEPFATIGFGFLDAKQMAKHTEMLRASCADEDEEDPHLRVIRNGIALTFAEPELVWSEGAVYQFSFRNPLLRIADSFGEFLEHYLASGCFCSHEFPAIWKFVSAHVPIDIPVAKNVWVTAYKKQFPAYWR